MIRKTRDLILRFLVLFVHIFEAILIASADGGFLWKLFILFGAVQLSESLPALSSAYSDCALRICWRLLKSYFLPGLKNRFGCCCSFCFLSLLGWLMRNLLRMSQTSAVLAFRKLKDSLKENLNWVGNQFFSESGSEGFFQSDLVFFLEEKARQFSLERQLDKVLAKKPNLRELDCA